MGISLTGTHVIFFIASIIAAGAVSGVFIAVTLNVTTSLSERGDRLQNQLDIDFTVINDPNTIPTSGVNYMFYIKNIGGSKLTTTNQTFQVFLDGEFIPTANFTFSETTTPIDGITTLYVRKTIAAGDHTLRVVGPQAVDDEFIFTK